MTWFAGFSHSPTSQAIICLLEQYGCVFLQDSINENRSHWPRPLLFNFAAKKIKNIFKILKKNPKIFHSPEFIHHLVLFSNTIAQIRNHSDGGGIIEERPCCTRLTRVQAPTEVQQLSWPGEATERTIFGVTLFVVRTHFENESNKCPVYPRPIPPHPKWNVATTRFSKPRRHFHRFSRIFLHQSSVWAWFAVRRS